MRLSLKATALVVVLLLASGCAGKNDGKAEPSASLDPNSLPEGVTNVLEGTVQGIDFYPVDNATVRINGLEDNTTSDEAGYYRFESLPPRDYIITVTKEGYRPKSQRAILEDDKIFQLDFIMEEVPLEQPYHRMQEFNGLIFCQLAYQTTPDNTQRPQCAPPGDPLNRQDHLFDVMPGGAQVVVEVVWTQTTAASKMLTITVESLGDNAIQFAFDKGESPLRTVVSQSLLRQNMPEGGKLRVLMEAAPSITGDEAATDVGLALQQGFKVYFTVFYIEPGPTSYSALPK